MKTINNTMISLLSKNTILYSLAIVFGLKSAKNSEKNLDFDTSLLYLKNSKIKVTKAPTKIKNEIDIAYDALWSPRVSYLANSLIQDNIEYKNISSMSLTYTIK